MREIKRIVLIALIASLGALASAQVRPFYGIKIVNDTVLVFLSTNDNCFSALLVTDIIYDFREQPVQIDTQSLIFSPIPLSDICDIYARPKDYYRLKYLKYYNDRYLVGFPKNGICP